MASTKIINVLKDDGFEEILNLFQNSPAKEVIFVLPKNSRAFKKEEHFMVLSHEARKADKSVSILCSSPDINTLARKYDFDVLLTEESGRKKAKPLITAVNQIDEEEEKEKEEPVDFDSGESEIKEETDDEINNIDEEEEKNDEENHDEEDREEEIENKIEEEAEAETVGFNEDDDYRITGASAKRNLEDILRPPGADARNVKISSRREKPVGVDVKKIIGSTKSLEDLENVWQRQDFRSRSTENRISPNEEPIRFKIKKFKLKHLSRGRRLVILIGIAAFIIIGLAVYVTAGSAKITVTPQKKTLNFQMKISASDRYSSVDTAFNKIPGQLFTIQKSVSRTFDSTGQKDVAQKARGKITVYNLQNQPQQLIATTRFQSENGLIFRTLAAITVPAAKNSSTPGTIEVDVVADKSGQEYNIPAGKFTVPAFKERNDTIRYQKVYGESAQPMRGGTNGKAKVVAENDFSRAKNELTEQLKKEISDETKNQTQGLEVINTESIQTTVPQSTAQIDEPVDNFTMTMTGTLTTIAFKDSDLNQLVSAYVAKTNNLVTVPEKIETTYGNPKFSKTDSGSGVLEFTAVIKGDGFAKIDEQKIIQDLLGKNETEIKSYLEKSAGIDSAKVLLSPFWVSKMPKDKNNISFEIKYE